MIHISYSADSLCPYCSYAAECEMNCCTGFHLTSSRFSLQSARVWSNLTSEKQQKRKTVVKIHFMVRPRFSVITPNLGFIYCWGWLLYVKMWLTLAACSTHTHTHTIESEVEVGVSHPGVELLLELDKITFMGTDWSCPVQWNQLDSPKTANLLLPSLQTCWAMCSM